MAGPHRDFDAARAERLRGTEPVTFTIGGQRFRCVLEPALGDALALADAPEPQDSQAGAARAIVRFVESLLGPEDRGRWRRLGGGQRYRRFARRRPPVSSAELIELGAWLSIQYTARPTVPSSASSSGRRHSGDPSSGRSSTGQAEATSQASGSGSL